MINPSERKDVKRLPLWIPDRVGVVLKTVSAKEPIDLSSEKVLDRYFGSRAEIQDVSSIVAAVRNPLFMGLYGSRANGERPPLFPTVRDFDHYYANVSGINAFDEYFEARGISLSDYYEARRYLKNGEFNQRYRDGVTYSKPIVDLLVSDIDLLIITDREELESGPQIGRRTNVSLDLNVTSPMSGFDQNPADYLELGLSQAIPLKL